MNPKRRPITLSQREAIYLVNALGDGGHLYRGKTVAKIVDKLRRRLDEDIPGTSAHAAREALKVKPPVCGDCKEVIQVVDDEWTCACGTTAPGECEQ
jgi:hypothetical protein